MDYREAASIFDQAVELARSEDPLPSKWLNRIKKLDRAANKTFIAMLGTALLARATDPTIDPFVLKASANPSEGLTSYSARGLATSVLVPKAVEHGVHLGVTGREPLNNQPFYGEARVHDGLPIRPAEKSQLDHLLDCLDRVAELSPGQALEALAAFVSIRHTTPTAPAAPVAIYGGSITLPRLATGLVSFLANDPEGGKRGQAMVAAALDMAFEGVEVGRINDPSRRSPGDVRVRSGRRIALAAEARQKPVSEADVQLFGQRLVESGVGQGLYAALSPKQQSLNVDGLQEQVAFEYGIALEIAIGASQLLRQVMVWSGQALEDMLRRFPERMIVRLRELEVSAKGVSEWTSGLKTLVEDGLS